MDLSAAGTPPTAVLVVRATSDQAETPPSNTTTPSHAPFSVFLIPPMADLDHANEVSDTDSSWWLACVAPEAITFFSPSHSPSAGLQTSIRAVLQQAHRGTISNDCTFNVVTFPQAHDVQTDLDCLNFFKCVAIGVCALAGVDVPQQVFGWAWIGALGAVSARRERVSEIYDAVELPDTPEIAAAHSTSTDSNPLQALAANVQACRSHINAINRQRTFMDHYIYQLRLIQRCISSVAKLQPSSQAGSTANLTKEIKTLTGLLPHCDPDSRELYEKNIAKLQKKMKSEAGKAEERYRRLQELEAWVNTSINAAETERNAWTHAKGKALDQVDESILAANKLVQKERASSC